MSYRNSFIAGELTPWLDGLTNLEQYGVGCRTMHNMIATPYGGARRRPGTWLEINTELTGTYPYTEDLASQIFEFSFSDDDSTLLKISYRDTDSLAPVKELSEKKDEKQNYLVSDNPIIEPDFDGAGDFRMYLTEASDFIFNNSKVVSSLNEVCVILKKIEISTDIFHLVSNRLKYKGSRVYALIVNSSNELEVYTPSKTIVPTTEYILVEKNTLAEVPTDYMGCIQKDKNLNTVRVFSHSNYDVNLLIDVVSWSTICDIPYTYDHIEDIKHKQSADVIFLTHPNYPPAKISRTSKNPNVFEYEEMDLAGPYKPRNTDTDKLLIPEMKNWVSGTQDSFSYGEITTIDNAPTTVSSIPSRILTRTWQRKQDDTYYYYDIKYPLASVAGYYVNEWVNTVINGVSGRYKISAVESGYLMLKAEMWHNIDLRHGEESKGGGWISTFTTADTIFTGGESYYRMIDSTNFDIDPLVNAPLTTTTPLSTPTQWTQVDSNVLTGSVTLASSWDEFTETSVGEKYLIYQDLPQARYEFNGTGAPSGGSGDDWLAKTYQTSEEWYVGKTIEITTYGAWKGTVIVEASYDNGVSWITLTTYLNPVEAKNYTEEIELDGRLQLVRCRTLNDYNDLGTTDPDIKLVVRPTEQEVGTDVVVTSYVSAREVVVSIIGTLTNANPTYNWAYNEFTTLRGYPSELEIFENRLVFASTDYAYNTLWASKVDNWYEFEIGTKATDAWSYKLPEQEKITYIKEKGKLFIGTGAGDWVLSGAKDEIISASNVKLVKNSNRGSNGLVEIVDDSLFFVGKDGRSLFSYSYDYVSDSFQAEDLTILAKHIFEANQIVDMKLQRRPYTIIWCLMEDGTLAGLTYNKKMGVVAWHTHTTSQHFSDPIVKATKGIAVLGSLDEDILYINNDLVFLDGINKYQEILLRLDNFNNTSIYLDSTIKTNTIFIADSTRKLLHRDSFAEYPTAGYPTDSPKYFFGYVYTSTLTTTPIDMAGQDGKGYASKRQIPTVYTKFIDSGKFKAGTKTGSNASDLSEFLHEVKSGVVPILESGIFKIRLKDGWDREKMITMVSDEYLPLNVIYIETNDLRGE